MRDHTWSEQECADAPVSRRVSAVVLREGLGLQRVELSLRVMAPESSSFLACSI